MNAKDKINIRQSAKHSQQSLDYYYRQKQKRMEKAKALAEVN